MARANTTACVETTNGFGSTWHSVPLVMHAKSPAHHADETCSARQADRIARLCNDAPRTLAGLAAAGVTVEERPAVSQHE